MTRDEFLGRLGELLACLPADQVRETQEFYAEAIADRMEDGMGEEEAVAAMGAPGEVAEAALDDLPAVPRAIAKTRRILFLDTEERALVEYPGERTVEALRAFMTERMETRGDDAL